MGVEEVTPPVPWQVAWEQSLLANKDFDFN